MIIDNAYAEREELNVILLVNERMKRVLEREKRPTRDHRKMYWWYYHQIIIQR